MSLAVENKQEYAELLANVLPQVIHTEQENERCTAALENLLRQSKRTPARERMAELLALLIEDFEEKRYSLPPAAPRDKSAP